MDISFSWNFTAVAFGSSALLSSLVTWKAFHVWKRGEKNETSRALGKNELG